MSSKIVLQEALRVERGGDFESVGTAILGADGVAFGGHVAAQALIAAQCIEPARQPQSIHSIFLGAALPGADLHHRIEILKKGRAFTVIRVETWQGARRCLTSTISFHDGELAPEHQLLMPPTKPPQAYPTSDYSPPGTNPEVRRCFAVREILPFPTLGCGNHPQKACWLRSHDDLGPSPFMHCAALIWFADLSMPWTTELPYSESHGKRLGASLDHSLWFHRPFRADQWLLFTQESTIYTAARALTRGVFFSEDGKLVATATQETLLRRIRQR